jgi:hypothetical protein
MANIDQNGSCAQIIYVYSLFNIISTNLICLQFPTYDCTERIILLNYRSESNYVELAII